jgi:putative DNA-invertase from lambdoid prophage Rac
MSIVYRMETDQMRALIYARRSTDSQDNTHIAQEHELRAWAAKQGIKTVIAFTDLISGSKGHEERPALTDLLESVRPGDVVAATKRDRLSRDVLNAKLIEREIKSRGGELITLDAQNRLTANILDAIAEDERERIAERTRTALADLKRRGLPSGTPELGTQIIGGELADNLIERAKIERVRAWRAEGLTLAEIRERCAAHNITSRSGRTPALNTIRLWVEGVNPQSPTSTAPKSPARGPAPQRRVQARPENQHLEAMIRLYKEQGLSVRAIAAKIEEQGFRTRRGTPIGKTQIQRILRG